MKRLSLFLFFNLLICFTHNTFAMETVWAPGVEAEVIAAKVAEVAKLTQQIRYLEQTLKTLSNAPYQWNTVQNTINELGNAINQVNTIAYNAQNLDSQFKKLYPGYQPPKNYFEQYQQIVNTTVNTLNSVLNSLGTNAKDFQQENMRLAFLQSQAQNVVGQTQAIQAASQIALEQVSQMQLLRQTLLAQTNAQTAYYVAQTQKEASAKAELEQVVQTGEQTVPAYGTSGNTLSAPNNF